MGMQLKRDQEQEPQEPQGGSFLGDMADTPWGMPCLLFVLVVLTMACFAGALAVSGNPPL